MSRLGIDQLTFGTEEVLDYQAIATVYSENEAEMEAFREAFRMIYPIHKRPKNVGNPLLEWSSQGYSQSYSGAGLCQGLCWEGISA